jgi:hypothetical protein
MTDTRVSRLQTHILLDCLSDDCRPKGDLSSRHPALVQALGKDKGNIRHSLRRLEPRGATEIGHSPGGKAEYVVLTSEG